MAYYCDNLEHWEQREDLKNFQKDWENGHMQKN